MSKKNNVQKQIIDKVNKSINKSVTWEQANKLKNVKQTEIKNGTYMKLNGEIAKSSKVYKNAFSLTYTKQQKNLLNQRVDKARKQMKQLEKRNPAMLRVVEQTLGIKSSKYMEDSDFYFRSLTTNINVFKDKGEFNRYLRKLKDLNTFLQNPEENYNDIYEKRLFKAIDQAIDKDDKALIIKTFFNTKSSTEIFNILNSKSTQLNKIFEFMYKDDIENSEVENLARLLNINIETAIDEYGRLTVTKAYDIKDGQKVGYRKAKDRIVKFKNKK